MADMSMRDIQDRVVVRLDRIEQSIRLMKDNDLSHIDTRLTRLEEGQNWMKGLLFSIIGVIIASSVGVVLTVRW
tara:strand:- start:541 stop:762 length:222 start_codon:yes stop_codon:yes gene_type:complete